MSHSHTNELIHESSPYLLQHAHNPVHWMAWSERALQLAKDQDKPILISIGYAACHWCHVMERESFEDEHVAALMNDYFINIKIDREERPDLDHIYMDAVQLMTGSGGWPLHAFLTPDGKPFFGGTYFPPRRLHQRMSWTEVLEAVNKVWKDSNTEVLEQAEKLLDHMRSSQTLIGQYKGLQEQDTFGEATVRMMAEQLMSQADTTFGGIGRAPKFPQTFSLQYLLMYGHFKKNEVALQHALHSIRAMIRGGLYDQLGGGFARYSTDDEWLVPHFEKMLYDNALLIGLMADAYMITKDPLFQKTIEATIGFCERELKSPQGGYYAALDADSEGEEGKYYVWSYEEFEAVLGGGMPMCASYFGVTQQGNWEATNILTQHQHLHQLSAQYNMSPETFMDVVEKGRLQLLEARSKRIRPITDHKILLSWNALYLSALCKASMALKNEHYRELAIKLSVFLNNTFIGDGKLNAHVCINEITKHTPCLDDLACYIQSQITLQELTADAAYLDSAKQILEQAIATFGDASALFFHYTSVGQTDLIYRKTDMHDGALPSGNSLMAENLYYLSVIFERHDWRERAIAMWNQMHVLTSKYPASFGVWATALLKQHLKVKELVLTGSGAPSVLPELLQHYYPQKILQTTARAMDYPLFAGKSFTEPVSAYICEDYTCKKTETDVQGILKSLDELSTY